MQKEAKKQGTCRICCSFRPWTASPAPFLEQSLEILSCCSHQRLTVDAPESSQAKAPHGLLIRLGRMVGADALQILLIEAASEGPTALTVRAVCFEGAGIAGGRIGSIFLRLFGVGGLFQGQKVSFLARLGLLFGML